MDPSQNPNDPQDFSSGLAKFLSAIQGGGQLGAFGPQTGQDPTNRPAIGPPRRTLTDVLSGLLTGQDYYNAKGGGQSGWRPGPVNPGVPGQGLVPPNFTVRPGDEGADQRSGLSKWLVDKLGG